MIPTTRDSFLRLGDARNKIENWRRIYNEQRPHSSLRFTTPQAYRLAWEQRNQIEPDQENLSLQVAHI